MKAIAFINQKGGVGKSTTTLHTASYLVKKGYKVLTIDLDPQGNLSKAFGINTDGVPTLKEVLLGEVPVNQAIYSSADFGYVIPSDIVTFKEEVKFAYFSINGFNNGAISSPTSKCMFSIAIS